MAQLKREKLIKLVAKRVNKETRRIEFVTREGFVWRVGELARCRGERGRGLCSQEYLHAYRHLWQAHIWAYVHGSGAYDHVLEVEAAVHASDGTKVGFRQGKVIRKLPKLRTVRYRHTTLISLFMFTAYLLAKEFCSSQSKEKSLEHLFSFIEKWFAKEPTTVKEYRMAYAGYMRTFLAKKYDHQCADNPYRQPPQSYPMSYFWKWMWAMHTTESDEGLWNADIERCREMAQSFCFPDYVGRVFNDLWCYALMHDPRSRVWYTSDEWHNLEGRIPAEQSSTVDAMTEYMNLFFTTKSTRRLAVLRKAVRGCRADETRPLKMESYAAYQKRRHEEWVKDGSGYGSSTIYCPIS